MKKKSILLSLVSVPFLIGFGGGGGTTASTVVKIFLMPIPKVNLQMSMQLNR